MLKRQIDLNLLKSCSVSLCPDRNLANLFGTHLGLKEMKLRVQREIGFWLSVAFIHSSIHYLFYVRFSPLSICYRKLFVGCKWHGEVVCRPEDCHVNYVKLVSRLEASLGLLSISNMIEIVNIFVWIYHLNL